MDDYVEVAITLHVPTDDELDSSDPLETVAANHGLPGWVVKSYNPGWYPGLPVELPEPVSIDGIYWPAQPLSSIPAGRVRPLSTAGWRDWTLVQQLFTNGAITQVAGYTDIRRYDSATDSYEVINADGSVTLIPRQQLLSMGTESSLQVDDQFGTLRQLWSTDLVGEQTRFINAPFDPHASRNRLLEIRFHYVDLQDVSLNSESPTARYRQHLYASIIDLLPYSGEFVYSERPTREEILRELAKLSDEDLSRYAAQVSASVLDRSALGFESGVTITAEGDILNHEGDVIGSISPHDPRFQTAIGTEQMGTAILAENDNLLEFYPSDDVPAMYLLDVETDAQALLNLSTDYLMASQLDTDLATIRDWDAEAHKARLDSLHFWIERMPTDFYGIPIAFIPAGFRRYYELQHDEYQCRLQIRASAEAFELAMHEQFGSLPAWMYWAGALPLVGDALDVGTSLWEAAHGRIDAGALAVLLPFVPAAMGGADDAAQWARAYLRQDRRFNNAADWAFDFRLYRDADNVLRLGDRQKEAYATLMDVAEELRNYFLASYGRTSVGQRRMNLPVQPIKCFDSDITQGVLAYLSQNKPVDYVPTLQDVERVFREFRFLHADWVNDPLRQYDGFEIGAVFSPSGDLILVRSGSAEFDGLAVDFPPDLQTGNIVTHLHPISDHSTDEQIFLSVDDLRSHLITGTLETRAVNDYNTLSLRVVELDQTGGWRPRNSTFYQNFQKAIQEEHKRLILQLGENKGQYSVVETITLEVPWTLSTSDGLSLSGTQSLVVTIGVSIG